MLRMAAALCTSTATNRGICTFREDKKEMRTTNSKHDIFINIISQQGVPASKEDVELANAITDVIAGVRAWNYFDREREEVESYDNLP